MKLPRVDQDTRKPSILDQIAELKGEIDKSTEICKKQTTDMWTAFRCSRDLDNWLDRFYFIAPISIIGYVIFRVVTFFIQ